jgi:hypothetical protein
MGNQCCSRQSTEDTDYLRTKAYRKDVYKSFAEKLKATDDYKRIAEKYRDKPYKPERRRSATFNPILILAFGIGLS